MHEPLPTPGNSTDAIVFSRRTVESQPDSASAWFRLADNNHKAARLDEALVCYQKAIRLQPNLFEAHYNSGLIYQSQKRPAEASACYRKALQINPDLAQAHNNMGQLHLEAKEFGQAFSCFLRAIREKADFAEPHFNLGEALRSLNRPQEAAVAYKAALRLKPSLFGAWNNLGNLLREEGNLADAAACFREVVRLQPDVHEGYYNLGSTLKDMGDFEEAIAHLAKAVHMQPQHAESWNNLALSFKSQGDWDNALAYFSESLRLKEDLAAAHWNRSFVYLLKGCFQKGWQDYEWRFRLPTWKLIYPFRERLPRWNGTTDRNRSIIVYDEQGIGDTLQFVRYLPMVKKRCGRVVLETRRELIPLFSDFPGLDEVVERPPSDEPSATADCCIPLLSLPLVFGTTLETIPTLVPYIRADTRKSDAWRKRISAQGLKVGLVWAGRPQHQNDRNRSCRLDVFLPLARIQGLQLFSLQKGPAEAQIKDSGLKDSMVHLGAELNDFSDTAALMSQLDLLISVDTSVAHLAGAMARPVWVMLPTIPDWRWMLDRKDSPWYPSMRLFRQPSGGNWSSVVDGIASKLRRMIVGFQS